MLIEVKVPQLSESVAEATLLNWHKKPGQYVNRDENLVDIETDKVVLETPAPHAGVLVKISRATRARYEQRVIAQIDTEAAKPAAQTPLRGAEPARRRPKRPRLRAPQSRRLARVRCLRPRSSQRRSRSIRARFRARDAAAVSRRETCSGAHRQSAAEAAQRRPARQRLGGRHRRSGARAAMQRAPAPKVDLGQLGERPEQRVPMSRLRARIAERLIQSQSTAAILTTFNEVNMQPVIDLRKHYQDRFEKEHGVKLGFMSFFVKAVVYALKKYPIVNASIDGNDIVYHGYYDIGIAVGSPRGLVVPILRDADQLELGRYREADRRFRPARAGRGSSRSRS